MAIVTSDRVTGDGSTVDEWIAAVCRELGLAGVSVDGVDVDSILEVAKHAAHEVMRPAAPVTTYLMGLAVAQGADPGELAERVAALAQTWATGDRPVD